MLLHQIEAKFFGTNSFCRKTGWKCNINKYNFVNIIE